MASEKITAIIEELKGLTVLELSELVHAVEDEFGVSAAAAVAVAGPAEGGAAAARILCKYAKDHENFKVKSGYLDGAVVDMDTITALSKLPTRDVLLANVLGAFQAPIAAFARVIQAVVDEGGFDACLAKKDAEAAPAEEAAEAPAAE